MLDIYFELIKDHTPAIIIKPKEEPKLPTKEEYNSKEDYSRNEEYISNGSCEVLVGKTCSDLSKVHIKYTYISDFFLKTKHKNININIVYFG